MNRRRSWRAGLALLVVLFAATAAWSGWRYHALGEAIDAGRDSLWRRLQVPAGDSVDASVHVSRAVDATETEFDRLVLLSTARRLALFVGVGCAFGALSTALVLRASRARESVWLDGGLSSAGEAPVTPNAEGADTATGGEKR